MKPLTNQQLAEKIACALLASYMGLASRIVLMVGEPERDAGGRCYQNVVDTIRKVLYDHAE